MKRLPQEIIYAYNKSEKKIADQQATLSDVAVWMLITSIYDL